MGAESSGKMGRLHEAIKQSNITEVKKLLRTDSPNERDPYHQTPLHVACGIAANPEAVKLLLRKKADVNVQDRNGWTPLHCSANEGQLPISELLLSTDGIDVGMLNKDGTSALHYLVRNNPTTKDQLLYQNVLRLYMEKRGDINSQSKHGEAALHQACLRGNIVAVKFLLEKKAAINILNKIGETALHYAVRAGQKEIIQLLLEAGADTTIKSGDGTPLDIAASAELANLIQQYSSDSKKFASSSYDVSEYKLRVKIVRAVNLQPVGDKDTVSSICHMEFNKQKYSTKAKTNTINPKWNEVFLFDIEDASNPLKFFLVDPDLSENNEIGNLVVLLTELEIDTSGSGTALKNWFTIKRKPRRAGKATPKLRLELSFILKSTLEESSGTHLQLAQDNSDEEETGQGDGVQGAIFGIKRGPCKLNDCDCDTYQAESERGGVCQNCGHWPAQHQNLGKDENDKDSAPVDKPSGEGDDPNAMFSNGFSWQIDANELEFSKVLGEGTSAQVFRGTYRSQEVAIKVLKEKTDAKTLLEFRKEFEIMSALRSPHVVFFYGAALSPSLCMVLEFCAKGALYDVLSDLTQKITWKHVFRAAIDTVKGLLCLHNWKPQIVHRDMKSLNLLVDENWTVKVSDFGTSRFTSGDKSNSSTLSKLRGTYAYCPPEVYFGKDFTPKSDIFSFGVILWEMAYRCLTGVYAQPFSEFTQIVFDFQIIIQSAKKDLRPTIPESCPEAFKDLINRCWHKSPTERPSTTELAVALREVKAAYLENKSDWDSRCIKPEPTA